MKMRELVSISLLIGMGAVLHAIVPPFFLGMKPDMLLSMMFLAIILFPGRKNVLLAGLITGILSALTTGFPGGQLPNVIDKLLTAFMFYGLLLAIQKLYPKRTAIVAVIITGAGTLFSGFVFLTAALLIVGLPGEATMLPLYLAVVLPAAAFNSFLMFVVYPAASMVQSKLGNVNYNLQ